MTFGTVLRVSDLPHGGKLKFLTAEDTPIAHVTSVKEEVVATPEAEAAAAGCDSCRAGSGEEGQAGDGGRRALLPAGDKGGKK